MPRLFVPPESLRGERATLDRAAHRHLVKVLRLGRGDVVHVFDGAGTEIEARIESRGDGVRRGRPRERAGGCPSRPAPSPCW